MTAAKNQGSSVEDVRLRIVLQVHCHSIEAALVVHPLQTFLTDRNKLRLVVSRTARLGIPLHTAWPEDIRLTMAHTVDGALQFLVGIDGDMTHEILVALHPREGMVPSVFCVLGLGNQTTQHCFLQRLSFMLMLLQFTLARFKDLPYYTGYTHLLCTLSACKGTQIPRNGGIIYVFFI